MGETKPMASNTKSALITNSEFSIFSNFSFTLIQFKELTLPFSTPKDVVNTENSLSAPSS